VKSLEDQAFYLRIAILRWTGQGCTVLQSWAVHGIY